MIDSLFNLCLEFVARNIRDVESFCGLPDVVGQQIFHAVKTTGQLGVQNQAWSYQIQQILSQFTPVYKDVLTELNTEGEHLFLAGWLDILVVFTQLRALNVSSCSIGDQHEILFHISTLTSLEVLVLRNNNLTDEGIRRLTAPLRIKKTGPLGLKTLDLSENADVTVGSLKFLRVFRELTLLNLSFTAIQELQHRQSVPELREYARGRSLVVLTAVSEKLRSEVRVMTEVKTKGWASQVISSWRQEGEEACRPATHHRFKARRFYGTDKNLKPPLALPPRKKDWAETGVGSLVLIHDSLVPSFASSTTAQHGGVSPSSSLQATAASVPSNLVTTRLPPRGGGQSSSTTPPPPPPQVTVLSASLATRTPPVQDEVFCSTPGTLQQSPGSASLCRAFQEGSQSPLTTERPATSAASCRFEGKGSNRQSAGAGATPSPKKIREEARSSSAKSCSHSLKDNQQLRIKKQDSADVATQGSNESKSVRKNKLKTSAGLNQASSMSGCLKLQSANDDRLEERSLHRASRGERVQQGCYARGSGQQKRRREEEDLGQDDLVLLCQYGYSGK